ncbi:hypothetical protein CBL_20630 [Carabus blaptoides fortunei]
MVVVVRVLAANTRAGRGVWRYIIHDILNRIKNAARHKHHILACNQQLDNPGLRSGLVIARGNKAYIIDVTAAFENKPEAFQAARQRKIDKYTPLARAMESRYPNSNQSKRDGLISRH